MPSHGSLAARHKRTPSNVSPLRDEPSRTPDEALVRRAKQGDAVAKARLYRRHAPRILNLACRLLGDRSDADDVMQDAFIQAFEKLDRLQADAAFGAWLRQIAVRQIQRRFRRASLVAKLGLTQAPGPHLSSHRPDIDAELREVEETLRTMPHRAWFAWVLKRVDGMSVREVAEALRCSSSTIKRDLALVDAALEERFGEAAR